MPIDLWSMEVWYVFNWSRRKICALKRLIWIRGCWGAWPKPSTAGPRGPPDGSSGQADCLGVRWVGPASRIRVSKVKAGRTPRGHPGPLFMDGRTQAQRRKRLPKVLLWVDTWLSPCSGEELRSFWPLVGCSPGETADKGLGPGPASQRWEGKRAAVRCPALILVSLSVRS